MIVRGGATLPRAALSPTSCHLYTPCCPPHPQEAPDGELANLRGLLEPLQEVCRDHTGGKEGYARQVGA